MPLTHCSGRSINQAQSNTMIQLFNFNTLLVTIFTLSLLMLTTYQLVIT